VAESVTSPELVLAHLDRLPTLPPVALRLLQVTGDATRGAADVVALLRADQTLTARLLAVVNSAAAGLRTPVTTVERAVPLIGFQALRGIVLATATLDIFPCPHERTAAAFDRAAFWRHALAVACAARGLAAAAPDLRVDAEEAFVAGLLHDLGKVALAAVFPKAYERAAARANAQRGDIADCERSVLGADHTVAGRRLAERWRLPAPLQEAIWLHHLAPEALPSSAAAPALIGLVDLADTLAREQHIGYSGNHVFYADSGRLAERLRLAPEAVQRVVTALPEEVARHAALLGLDGVTSADVYGQALARANDELGRLNVELLAGQQRLAAGARYFQALVEFDRSLTEWTTPAAVAAALAAAAPLALQRPRVVAFGLRANFAALDVCAGPAATGGLPPAYPVPVELLEWLTTAGAARERLVEAPPAPLLDVYIAATGAAPTAPVWLLCVTHDRQVVGGVLYESEADEPQRLAGEMDELRALLASVGFAFGRANAATAARRLADELAESNRRLQHVQHELARSRLLATIAEMAAGAGHELNSPLTVISGRAQMLLGPAEDPEVRRSLQVIIDKAHECSGIVSELMDFARPRPPQLADVDAAALLVEVRNAWLQQRRMPASQLRTEAPGPAAQPAAVRADRAQLASVLNELISNAADALPAEGGTITLRCGPAAVDDAVELVVADNGCGMSPATLQRAFDPFFSHRRAGRGRGLGLARALRIVEAHGGKIWLESRPGEGTTAHVLLPRGGGQAESRAGT